MAIWGKASVNWHGDIVMAEIQKGKKTALKRIGAMIAKEAKAICPVGIEIKSGNKIWKEREPGTLRASVRYRLTKRGDKVQIIAGSRSGMNRGGRKYVGRMPFYAHFVEFGTSKMVARPFIRPAYYRFMGRIEGEFRRILR